MFVYRVVLFAVLIVILAIASIYDFRERIIPNKLVAIGAVLGVGISLVAGYLLESLSIMGELQNMLLGALVGGLPLLCIEVYLRLVCKKQGIGGGDIKLYAMCGLFLGLELTISSYLALSVISLLTVGGLLLSRKLKRKDSIPFGPLISIAVVITFFTAMWV